ncbi:MAG: EpsG family protein [Lachnospiraceae bacterium]|nr:EpsG family protein [Lachnospiraceae bacterium]
MIVYITLTILVTALGLFVTSKNAVAVSEYKAGLSRQTAFNLGFVFMVFMLLFGVSACRIAVGNDYWVYRDYILKIAQNRHVATEFGFNWLVRICQFLTKNDECYLLVLGIFSFFTVFFFVKAMYEQSAWFGMSVFLLCTGGYYFLSLNSVRYYFALAIALYCMKLVMDREYARFVIFVLIGACFHKSLLIILLLYPLARLKWNKYVAGAAGALCLSLVLFKDFYRRILFLVYPYYEDSMFDDGSVSVVNILKSVAVVIFALIYYKKCIKDSESGRFYLNLQIGSLMLYCFGSFIPEISRIGYYLNISMIFLIPEVLKKIEDRKQKIFFTVAISLAFIAYFAFFLKGADDISIRIIPYRNWIFN